MRNKRIINVDKYKCIRCNSLVEEFDAFLNNDTTMKCICSKCLSHNRIVSLKELDKINGE